MRPANQLTAVIYSIADIVQTTLCKDRIQKAERVSVYYRALQSHQRQQ